MQCNLFKRAEFVGYEGEGFPLKTVCHESFDSLRNRTCSHLGSLAFPKGFCVANVLPDD